jgi:hypothetical protein
VETRAYIDESGINKPLVREYGRAIHGVLVEDTKRGKKFQRTNIVAVRINGNIAAPLCYTENTTGAVFVEGFRPNNNYVYLNGTTVN